MLAVVYEMNKFSLCVQSIVIEEIYRKISNSFQGRKKVTSKVIVSGILSLEVQTRNQRLC